MIPLRNLLDQSFDVNKSNYQSSGSGFDCLDQVLQIVLNADFDRLGGRKDSDWVYFRISQKAQLTLLSFRLDVIGDHFAL